MLKAYRTTWAAALRTDQKGKGTLSVIRTCRFGIKWTDNHGLYGSCL